AVIRSRAVSKISLNRRRTLYSGLSAGIFSKRASNACFSSALKLSGSRRKAHIWDRKAVRWSLVSFALYSRVILPRQGSSACCCILTRRASEGSASEPALARRKICEIFESPLHAGLQAEGPVAGVSG